MSDESVMGIAGDEPIRPQFPIRVTAFGIQAVLIPDAEYQALLNRSKARTKGGRLSHLEKDPDVRAFILDRLGTDDMDRIREAAIKRFGVKRVPSRSAVNRLVVRTRAEEGQREKKRPA